MGLRVLTDNELESLLVGHSVKSYPGTGVVTQNVEKYLPNGECLYFGHRNIAMKGKYEIAGKIMCVVVSESERRCAIFAKTATGEYYKKSIGDRYGSPERVTVE